jgi:hypothetical protein
MSYARPEMLSVFLFPDEIWEQVGRAYLLCFRFGLGDRVFCSGGSSATLGFGAGAGATAAIGTLDDAIVTLSTLPLRR